MLVLTASGVVALACWAVVGGFLGFWVIRDGVEGLHRHRSSERVISAFEDRDRRRRVEEFTGCTHVPCDDLEAQYRMPSSRGNR